MIEDLLRIVNEEIEQAPAIGIDPAIKKLWEAVLKLAIREAISDDFPELRQRARDWIFAPAIEVGSFLWACDMLGLHEHVSRIHRLVTDSKPGKRVPLVQKRIFKAHG